MKAKIEINRSAAEAANVIKKKKDTATDIDILDCSVNSCTYLFESPLPNLQTNIAQMIEKKGLKNWSGVASSMTSVEEMKVCVQSPLFIFRGKSIQRIYDDSSNNTLLGTHLSIRRGHRNFAFI